MRTSAAINVPLVVFMLLGAGGRLAAAAPGDYCRPFELRGPVKRVLVETQIDDAAPRQKKSELLVSRDGRSATMTSYEADAPAATPIYPTTLFEYGDSGRLVRQRLRLDGKTDFTVTECVYDTEHRLSVVTMRSLNPQFDGRKISFSYSPTMQTELFETPVAKNLTTRTLDAAGRVLKEITIDQLRSFKRDEVEYAYAKDTVTTCWKNPPPLPDRQCNVVRSNDRGDEVERVGESGSLRTIYVYDAHGNWTSRRHQMQNNSGSQAFGDITHRTITYW